MTAGAVHWHSARGGSPVRRAGAFCRDNLASYWPTSPTSGVGAVGQQRDDNVDGTRRLDGAGAGAAGARSRAVPSSRRPSPAGFAARRWPEYADLIERAIRHRAGEKKRFDVDDVRAFVALVDALVAAGQSETAFAG
ncbi:MAG: hypothetical protein WKF76_00355 [Nocardioidaceae bacterium]